MPYPTSTALDWVPKLKQKNLGYHTGTAQRTMSVEILSPAAKLYKN